MHSLKLICAVLIACLAFGVTATAPAVAQDIEIEVNKGVLEFVGHGDQSLRSEPAISS